MQNKQPSSVHLSSELQFLIACCQAEPDLDALSMQMRNLKVESSPCEKVISLSWSQGMLPLFYKTLFSLNTDNEVIQTEILPKLKEYNMGIARRNMLMSAELLRIVKLLKENDIEVLSFKGPVLAQAA